MVGTDASDDTLTSSGFFITVPCFLTFLDGYPFTTSTTRNSKGMVSDLVAKKKSTDVIKIPSS